jgi:mannonate dehydratase
MKLGAQEVGRDEELRWLAALDVRSVCGPLPSRRLDEGWSVEALTNLRARIESFGIQLDMLPLPLNAEPIEQAPYPNILLGKSPERDHEIDAICRMIRNAGKAGIPALKYNLTLSGVVRTGSVRGRQGARYSAFDYGKLSPDRSLAEGSRLSPDEYWQRITYFLQRVVPVAEECKVKMACHPHDPPMPRDTGYRGIPTVLGSVEGLKRFVEIAASPYHGLNFCQGTVAEMLENPGREIFDVIRYFGSRRKIFNVHFRNIRGGFLKFCETFVDDGDVDMLRAMSVYREVGYDGMLMPDHIPGLPGDPDGTQAEAYTYGYIHGLLAAVGAEG